MGSVETESPSELCDSVVGITCEPEAADDGKAEISSSLESGAQEHVDTAAGLATEPRSTESVRLQEETGHESGDSTKETSKMSVDIVASGSQVDKAAAPKAAASASEQEPRIPETGVTSAVHSRRVAVAERQDAAVAGPAATHDACPATVGVGAASGLRAENVEPFVPRRSAHRRRDSLSGEIPMQGQPERYEARIHHHQQQQQLYGYDRETGNVSEAYYGRMYYRDQGRTTELQGRQVLVHTPGQGREPEWQISQTEGPRGTVYASDETYSFRFVMLSRYVGQFIGRHGANIKNIVNSSGVISISVEQDYVIDNTNQIVNVYGERDTCDSACYEILKFLFFMNTGRPAEECPDGRVQLMLLANDDYCGMLIGRDGRSLKQMRDESDTRISFAKLLADSRYMELYPERIVFITGRIRNVVMAQSEITAKQYSMRLHETQDGWHGYLSRRPNISRTMQDLDNNVICDIIIGNDVAGAVIGRRGANIKTIMMKSQALVSVLPKISELDSNETQRYVRIAGSHEGVFRASYMVFLYVTRALSEKPKMDSTVLDSQLFVPSSSVGHIIGKRGHRVRNTEARTDVKIYVLNAPQPPPSPSGSSRSRVKITGNFWNTQAAIREVMKIIQNVDRDGEVDHCYASAAGAASPSPQRQRRASLSTTRELAFSRSVDHFTGTQNKPTSGVGGATSFVDLAGVHSSQCEQIAGNKSQQPEADALSVTTGLSTGNVEESAAKVVRAEITEVSMVPAKETVSLKSEEVVSINKEKCEGQDNHVTGHITFQIKTGAESVSPELQSTRQLRNMENLLNSSCDQDGESNSIRNSAGGLGSAPVGELEINQTEVSSDNGEPTGLCCSGDTGVRKPVSNLGACEQNSASLQTQDGKSPPSDDRAETGSNTNLDYDNMKTECGKKENWATPLQSLDNSATQYSDDTTVQILSTCTNDEDDVSQGCSSGKENQTASEVLDSVDGEIASSTAMTSPSEGKALVVSAAKCESQRHSSALMSGEPAAVNAPSLTPGLVASSDGNICTPMRFATASDTENGNVTAVLKSDGGTISSDAREQIPAIIVSIYEKTVSAERGMPRELQALSAAVDEGTYPRTASTDSSSQHHVTTTTSDHIEDIGRDETEQETDMDVLMQENVDDSQCQSPLEQPIAPAESRPSSELATDAANGVTESASTRCEDGQPTTAGGDSKEVPSALDDGKHQMAADDIAPADDMTCLSQVDTDTVDAASQPRAESATATAASNLLPKQEELDNGIRISDPVQVQAD